MAGLSGLAEFGPALMMLRCNPLQYHVPQFMRRVKVLNPEYCDFVVIGLQAGIILSGLMQ